MGKVRRGGVVASTMVLLLLAASNWPAGGFAEVRADGSAAATTADSDYGKDRVQDLQPLIDRTPSGGTLTLERGRVYAGPATIDKPITLASAGQSTLTNPGDEPALVLKADGIVIRDLIIRDSGTDPKKPSVLVQSDRNRIEGIDLVTQGGGIYLREANDNELRNNRIQGAGAGKRSEAFSKRGNGIDLFGSSRNVIEGNTIIHVHDGIYVESSNETRVSGNTAIDSRYGFHFMFSGKPELVDNVGEGNVTGGMVMGVEGAVVEGNRFDKQTENVNSQGILLYDVHNSRIDRNRVEGNRVGVYIENSTGNSLADNEVSRNFIGMQMIGASGNAFKDSVFAANVIQAQATESDDNTLSGNYWDDFGGLDENGDGFSELRYEIDPFFLQATEDIDAFQIFFQSPGLPFLAEVFRTDTSKWLKDLKPRIEPPSWYEEPGGSEGRGTTLRLGLALLAASAMTIYRWGYRKS
ncbi:right-handed parallel beta-helix repeat-containing protein [Cohnella fermenti]|nr:NosD domain-containing protein [Cohnella fermenti]